MNRMPIVPLDAPRTWNARRDGRLIAGMTDRRLARLAVALLLVVVACRPAGSEGRVGAPAATEGSPMKAKY